MYLGKYSQVYDKRLDDYQKNWGDYYTSQLQRRLQSDLESREVGMLGTAVGVGASVVGAVIGSIILPGIGTTIGATLGAGLGRAAGGAIDKSDATETYKHALKQSRRFRGTMAKTGEMLSEYRLGKKEQDKEEIADSLKLAWQAFMFTAPAKIGGIKTGGRGGHNIIDKLGLKERMKDLKTPIPTPTATPAPSVDFQRWRAAHPFKLISEQNRRSRFV